MTPVRVCICVGLACGRTSSDRSQVSTHAHVWILSVCLAVMCMAFVKFHLCCVARYGTAVCDTANDYSNRPFSLVTWFLCLVVLVFYIHFICFFGLIPGSEEIKPALSVTRLIIGPTGICHRQTEEPNHHFLVYEPNSHTNGMYGMPYDVIRSNSEA